MNNNIGKSIAELRKKHNLLQQDLAKKLNVSNKTISKWECGNGMPDVESLANIAKIFNITIDELISYDEDNVKYEEVTESESVENEEVIEVDTKEEQENVEFEDVNKNIKNSMPKKKKLTIIIASVVSAVIMTTALLCVFLIPKKQDVPYPKIQSSSVFQVDEENNTLKCVVDSSVETFSFNNTLTVPDKNSWGLFSDEFGLFKIISKEVSLEVGDNEFFIIVTNEKNEEELYTICIRRKPVYSVSFNANGGTNVQPQTVQEGDLLTTIVSTRQNFEFVGWKKQNNQMWNFETDRVSANMTLTAVWKSNLVDINYELNGGTNNNQNPAKYNFKTGGEVELKAPTKLHYNFVGWFKDEALTQPITKLTSDIQEETTVYAKWESRLKYDESNYLKVENKEDLIYITQYADFWNKNIRLYANLDLADVEYSPIGTKTNPYFGIFDGNNFEISNLKMKALEHSGLFGYCEDLTVKNLTLSNISVVGEVLSGSVPHFGSLAGYVNNDLIIENCSSSGSLGRFDFEPTMGGFVGEVNNNATIMGSSAKVNIQGYFTYVGGFVAIVKNKLTITNSSQESNLSAVDIGGFACTAGELDINGSYVNSSIIGWGCIGGMVSRITGNGNSKIQNSFVAGTIEASEEEWTNRPSIIGSFIGSTGKKIEINNCYSTATLKFKLNGVSAYGGSSIGGIIGSGTADVKINGCYFDGSFEINVKNDYTGEIELGGISSNASVEIQNCYTASDVEIENASYIVETLSGTKADKQTILNYVKENWDSDVWNFSDNENPTLK